MTASPAAQPERLPLRRPVDPLAQALRALLGGARRSAGSAPWFDRLTTNGTDRLTTNGGRDGGHQAAVAALAQRLDDKGCATGRVTAARVEELSRAFDRLEGKLNAILVAVTATFLSTLAGLAVLVIRARLGLPGA